MKKLVIPSALLLAFASLAAHASTIRPDLLGDPVPAEQASRTVSIDSGTRYVDVMHGDVVRFVAGGKTFAYDFDGASEVAAIDLRTVAPAGLIDHEVIAYVHPNPADGGRRGGRGR